MISGVASGLKSGFGLINIVLMIPQGLVDFIFSKVVIYTVIILFVLVFFFGTAKGRAMLRMIPQKLSINYLDNAIAKKALLLEHTEVLFFNLLKRTTEQQFIMR